MKALCKTNKYQKNPHPAVLSKCGLPRPFVLAPALYYSPCVTQQLLKMLSHAQLQLSHSWQSKDGDKHRRREPSLWWPSAPPPKQRDHNPGGFYSMQPAFPPFPCAKQVHFPPPSTNMGSVRMKGQKAGKLFTYALTITLIGDLFGDTYEHMLFGPKRSWLL